MGFLRRLIYTIGDWCKAFVRATKSWLGNPQTEVAAASLAEVKEKTKELKLRMDHLADQEWCMDWLTHDYKHALERLDRTEAAYRVAKATVAKRKLEKRRIQEQAEVLHLRTEIRKLSEQTKIDIQEANELASWLESVQFGKRGPGRGIRKASSWLNQ